ncbi:MAG: alpha/beta fold hydrolase [Verrucomicrobia bacterium]|nr:alpha/beta fold hydrolase [Verrucomicrobiota bacterium]
MNLTRLEQLDHPAIRGIVFHPRPDPTPPDSARDLHIAVDGASLGARFHPADSPDAPLILFFHGNGEIASDYNDIAPMYNHLGMSFLAVDFRGYGRSTGTPTLATLLDDARAVWDALPSLCSGHGLKPARTYVMGRSLGSASALEIGIHAGDALAGLIIESGFAYSLQLISRLGGVAFDTDNGHGGLAHITKIARISVPTLILHGADDWIIPVADARALHTYAGAKLKRLVIIPGAGHNDLLVTGPHDYFAAIRDFVLGG